MKGRKVRQDDKKDSGGGEGGRGNHKTKQKINLQTPKSMLFCIIRLLLNEVNACTTLSNLQNIR